MARIIMTYNEQRPHASLDYLTLSQAHNQEGDIKKRWKPTHILAHLQDTQKPYTESNLAKEPKFADTRLTCTNVQDTE